MMEVMKMTSNDEELQAQGKMLNKVVAFCMEAAEKRGVTALGLRSPFDEKAAVEKPILESIIKRVHGRSRWTPHN